MGRVTRKSTELEEENWNDCAMQLHYLKQAAAYNFFPIPIINNYWLY